MKETTLLIFAVLLIIASITGIAAYFVNRSIRQIEYRILRRYREKIDKMPALIEVVRKHTKSDEAYREFLDLHRRAIVSANDRIFDILEMNSNISQRFAFLMRLALGIRGMTRDGNFITIRESITKSEGQIKELLIEHSRITQLYNSIIKARNATLVGIFFPGGKKVLVDRVV